MRILNDRSGICYWPDMEKITSSNSKTEQNGFGSLHPKRSTTLNLIIFIQVFINAVSAFAFRLDTGLHLRTVKTGNVLVIFSYTG
eukprot:c26742_g1_i2 orf=762-1016(+)